MSPDADDQLPALHPVVAYLEERREAEAQARRRRRLRLGLSVLGLLVAAVLVALVVQAVLSAPGSKPSAAKGTPRICKEADWDAVSYFCAHDAHELTVKEAGLAQIEVTFAGPGDRHFVGIVVEQLDPAGTLWLRVDAASVVARLHEGVEDWQLKDFLPLSSATSGGRYRLRAVVDDKALPAYAFDVVLDARPAGAIGRD